MDQVTALANSGASGILPIIMNFIALIVLSIVLFGFAMRAGRPAFISLILSLYVGLSLFMVFPWKEQMMTGDGMTKAVAGLLIFLALSAVPFFILRKVNTMGLMRIHPVPLFMVCVLAAGAILALAYHFLALGTILPATSSISAYVLPDQFLFYWLIAPLVALLVVAH